MMRLKILLFLIIIFLLSGLYFIENISQYFSNSKQVEYSRNQSKSKKVKTNMENNNIIIQAQGTQVSYFAGTRIKKSPKILITKGGTWNRIEDDIPLEKTMTKDGELTITELKKVRRVTQKKLSQSQPNLRFNCDKYPADYCVNFYSSEVILVFNFVVGTCALSE
jgi:cellulose synthase/poly-beta-1,6-N-acetylglucosamine synthase-like glycosyltransferase